MQRSEFLARVGDPGETMAEAAKLKEEAQSLWGTVRDEFFTRAGSPRSKPASENAHKIRKEADALTDRARALSGQAAAQRDAIQQPWSHIEARWLRHFGLPEVAARVEQARQDFIKAAEAA